jgi:Peptidase A4 family
MLVILAAASSGVAQPSARADVSSNWAGYVVTGPGSTSMTASEDMTYTDVTGQWVQPKATCRARTPTSLAIWVGLGGYSLSSQELEQVGTSSDCDEHGTPSYYIWYELVPADPVTLKLKIGPGDTIVSVVKANGSDILLQVTDRTRRTRFTRDLSMSSPDLTSAEWIAEAPTLCNDSGFCKQLPLTRFHSFAFTRTYATGNSAGGTITSPGWTSTALQLVPRSRRFFGDRNDSTAAAGDAGAFPSALETDGTGFTVTWQPSPSG